MTTFSVQRDRTHDAARPSRRLVRLLALAALSAGALAAMPAEGQGRPGGRPPNIVLILADDLGYGDIGPYGQTRIQTPRLDQMAREGMRFTQHYSGSSVCAPARSVLMTGQHTGHTTVRGNSGINPANEEGRVPLLATDLTVAEVLKGAGYTTGLVGKWGLGEPGTTGVPNAQGFDYFYGYLNQNHAALYFPDHLWRNGERVALEGNRNGARGEYTHDRFTEEALSFLDRNRERPFFLYLAYTLPHVELAIPEGDSAFASYAGRYPKHEATFAAMVTRLDRDVGRVLDRLRALGLAENTLVIFTSDNGPHAAEGHDPELFDGNGPLRGIKGDLYEGGIRVPTIAWWPGRVREGSTTAHPSAFWDFLPTAAEIAGVPAPRTVDGISYLPTLLGRPQPVHDYLYWELWVRNGGRRAVRMGEWKAVQNTPRGAVELFDLSADPAEQTDLAARHPEVVRRATAIFRQAHEPSPWFPFPSERRASTAGAAPGRRP